MDKRIGKRQKVSRKKTEKDQNLDTLFEQFYHAKVAEGRAKRTLESYVANYHYFTEFLERFNVKKSINNINVQVVRDYIVYMLNEKVRFDVHKFKSDEEKTVGLSPVTVNTRLKTLRVLFRFLFEEGLIEQDLMKSIKKVEENVDEVTILSLEELKKLLKTPNQRRYSEFRDYVLMNLLLDTFLRINEALSLKKEDIDFEHNLITVRASNAKNRRSRTVPIQKTTANKLRELLEEVEDFGTEFIFVANYGEKLEANNFRHRLKEYAQRAGITSRVHPHLFRHTGATMFLEAGGDLRHYRFY